MRKEVLGVMPMRMALAWCTLEAVLIRYQRNDIASEAGAKVTSGGSQVVKRAIHARSSALGNKTLHVFAAFFSVDLLRGLSQSLRPQGRAVIIGS